MLVTIDESNRNAEGEILRGMFEARKHVFIDLLKWPLPVVAERYEIDQFDDRHSVYLVITDAAGVHLASARLLATTRPGILNSLFTDLADAELPSGPDVYEITRFCLSRDLKARERRLVRNQLVTAIARHALTCGINTYTGVAEFGWMQQILAFGWQCAPLGFPKIHGGVTLGALQIDIAADTLDRLEAAGVYAELSERALRRAA